eukprot:6675835-Pyramimonas_sp.AAC.1
MTSQHIPRRGGRTSQQTIPSWWVDIPSVDPLCWEVIPAPTQIVMGGPPSRRALAMGGHPSRGGVHARWEDLPAIIPS